MQRELTGQAKRIEKLNDPTAPPEREVDYGE